MYPCTVSEIFRCSSTCLRCFPSLSRTPCPQKSRIIWVADGGFGLAILSELRANAKSLKERVACYKQGAELFQKIDSALSRVTTFATGISGILKDNQSTVPMQTLELFVRTLGTVKENINRADATYANLAPVDSTSEKSDDVEQPVKRKVKGFMYAKSLDKAMKDLEKELIPVEAMLHSLLTRLTTTLKTENMDGNMLNKMEEMKCDLSFEFRDRLTLVGDGSSGAAEVYCAGSNVPPLPDNLHVEFDTRDEEGNFCAPEGKLGSTLLSSTAARHVIVARGGARPATLHGASGMAGAGKTTALIALGHDEAVRNHFGDGILYMTLGADASVESIARGLSKIMKFTGARSSAAMVRKQTDLSEAVEDAALWFPGQQNLFLIDDVWPTKSCTLGYLSKLRNILEGSPDSRIALTTGNRLIGSILGSHVDFGARAPLCSYIPVHILVTCHSRVAVKHAPGADVGGPRNFDSLRGPPHCAGCYWAVCCVPGKLGIGF